MRKNNRIQTGRTIGERRERLETASERMAARKRGKQKQFWRILGTTLLFLAIFGGIVYTILSLFNREESIEKGDDVEVTYAPTIEVVDEDAELTGEKLQLSSRMSQWIGQMEVDLRELGYIATKALIPSGAIREMDFYIDGYSGFIKTTIDRGTGVSAEDAGRMIQYLEGIGVSDFEYIDVRVEGKGYWK